MSLFTQMRYMNPYDIHKVLINEYILKKPGDTRLLQRDNSRDKTDCDVLREHHKFIWNADDHTECWEAQFAKKYYDKLFKEYCICDLTLYKENKIAMRWRTEDEVLNGKGQFTCANKRCTQTVGLRTWEVNFGYLEDNTKRNALVKTRLCTDCSLKLNYHSKKKEVKRLKRKVLATHHEKDKVVSKEESSSSGKVIELNYSAKSVVPKKDENFNQSSTSSASVWEKPIIVETKSREEEMEDYLQDLLL